MQNFQQLYQVQRMVQAASEDPVTVQLPAWIWVYAASAWQDRLFAESNFTPLQQVGALTVLSRSAAVSITFITAKSIACATLYRGVM